MKREDGTESQRAHETGPAWPRDRLRALLVTEAAAKGTGRHVLDLAQGLLARGCEVHLLYSSKRADELFCARTNSMAGLRHTVLPMRRSIHPADLRAVWTTRRYLRKFGPFDVIHGHSSKGGAVARLAAMGTGVPALYTPHALVTMDPDLPRWKWHFYKRVELTLRRLSAAVIAVSPEEARAAVAIGLEESNVVMIPNGIESIDLAPREVTRRQLGIGEKEIVVGWIGRMVENKAPEISVKAVATALRAEPRLRLLLVGDGPLRIALANLCRNLGVSGMVLLPGEMDARAVLSAFDIFAISSRKEGMPYVVLEAMSAGLPVVATSTSGVELLVQPGVNGAVIAPDDADALAAAIINLTREPGLIARQGRASRAMILRFTVERMVDRTLALYERCASGRAAEIETELTTEME